MNKIEILKDIYQGFLKRYKDLGFANNCNNDGNASEYQKNYLMLIEKGKYSEAHHKICELIFEMAENEEKLWIRIDHIFSDNDNVDLDVEDYEKEVGIFTEISILTPSMLEYDQQMFRLLDEGNFNDAYRPYFLHFLIDMDKVEEKAIKFITNLEKLNQWYEGSFRQDYNRDDVIELPGYMEKTASPVIYSGRRLKVIDRLLSPKVVDDINATYSLGLSPCSKDIELNNELNGLLSGTDFTKARIYNVGTGNCIYLYGKNNYSNKRLLYDIGYHVSVIPAKFIPSTKAGRVAQAVRALRPNCIILSHWDSDHYKGCAYANKHIFECRWIAPNCDDASPNAKRLAKFLHTIGKLMIVDRINGRKISSIKGKTSELTLWMGETVAGVKEDSHITKANRQGIVIELSSIKPTVHCIMMGDVPYRSLPTAANFAGSTPYDYLLVPHHGAYMNHDLLTKSTKRGVAIVCAKKGANRPNKDHDTALRNNGYEVKLTEEANFSIDINLTKKDDFHYIN